MTRFHPQIRARGGTFNFSSLSNKGYGKSHLWTRRQRLQLDSLTIGGGHGFGDWWEAQEVHCAKYPHAINWGPVRPSAPRMLGLHPDFPNPKMKKKSEARKT